MLYQKAEIQDDKIVMTSIKEIAQSKLTAECWLIQFKGLEACKTCPALNTNDCGGQAIRKRMLKQ